MKRLVVVLLCCFMLVACAGTPINWSKAREVKVGMLRDTVVGIMGRPYSVATRDGMVIYVWAYANSFGGQQVMRVDFKDGTVVAVPDIPKEW
jgi:outer membrane protein assembly factor BamE (lipoprotein component of BamABCDE complex)